MDFLLPVAPRLGVYLPRYWRDIPRSVPIEMQTIGAEPLALADAKQHLRIDASITDDDAWVTAASVAARRQVENDVNRALVKTQYRMSFDQFPIERVIPLPLPPLVSVDSFTYIDLVTSTELTVDPTTYFVDGDEQPGRIVLVPGKIWPTGVRWQVGGKVTWTCGYDPAATPANPCPSRYVHAMKLLLGSWYVNREAGGVMRGSADLYPLGYESLTSDRIEYFG